MVESKREAWHDIVKRAEDAGADGLELNFGCPHGMSERGMGSAVGQVPEYSCMITEWVKEAARTPVLVKLTPNITDIRAVARAAKRGGADGLSAINTINSITGIDLDTLHSAARRGRLLRAWRLLRPGGEAHRAAPGAADRVATPRWGCPISGIGGIAGWRDAAEFILLGCGTVQVCTAAMHYGYRIVEDMIDGLTTGWTRKASQPSTISAALALPEVTEWKHLDLNYKIVARIDPDNASAATSATSPAGTARTSASIIDGHAQARRRVEARSRARIAITPIAKLDAVECTHGDAAGAHSARRRRGVRRLQSLLAGLPGGELHHHGAGRNGQAEGKLGTGSWEKRVRKPELSTRSNM